MSLDRSTTSDRETERIVRSWLSEGTTRLPDRVLDAVLDDVPSTPQRRAWWPAWRFDTMSNAMRIAIAATAVLVVAFIAIYILPGRNGSIGNPAATPTASATPSVTVSAGALIDIILAPGSPPPGMSHDGTTAGADALGRPIISRASTDADRSQPGFVDGRYSEFSNDSSGVLSWAVLFETVEDAERAYEFYLAEVESEAGYGLGPSADAGLGDEGICGVADPSDPSSTQVCLWRSGGLVLAVGTYGPVDVTAVRAIAAGMQARATGSPAPTSAATIPEGPFDARVLEPGTLQLDMPPGWVLEVNASQATAFTNKGADETGDMGLSFWREPGTVREDPCQEAPLDPPLGPSVDDLASHLASLPGMQVVPPRPVTLAGYQGQYLELTVGPDLPCAPDLFYPWGGRYLQAPDELDRIWILDVNGTRLIIDAQSFPGTSTADLAELQAIVDSIRITAASPSPTP